MQDLNYNCSIFHIGSLVVLIQYAENNLPEPFRARAVFGSIFQSDLRGGNTNFFDLIF